MVRVTVVVLVTPPPVPVTVIVLVPVVAFAATLICIAACPVPGAGMVEGLKRTKTLAPCPEAVKAIDELKPPVAVVAILTRPRLPRVMVIVLGAAARVKLPVGPVTVRLTVVVWVVLPAVPVTVMVYVPATVAEPTSIVMVEVPVPVIEVGLKLTVTPLGWPLAERVTGSLKPPVVVLVMVDVPEEPCATVTAVGLAERLKPPPAPVMVTATAAEGMPFATTNKSLAPVSIPAGTSKFVETRVPPVATPIVL